MLVKIPPWLSEPSLVSLACHSGLFMAQHPRWLSRLSRPSPSLDRWSDLPDSGCVLRREDFPDGLPCAALSLVFNVVKHTWHEIHHFYCFSAFGPVALSTLFNFNTFVTLDAAATEIQNSFPKERKQNIKCYKLKM